MVLHGADWIKDAKIWNFRNSIPLKQVEITINCRLDKYNERVREGEIERVRQPGIGKAFAMPNPRPDRPETWGWVGTMLKT